jgi:hypothetical protein
MLKLGSTHMVVDTHSGLKIVRCTRGNFFSGLYAVQFLGSEAECNLELKRLKGLNYDNAKGVAVSDVQRPTVQAGASA